MELLLVVVVGGVARKEGRKWFELKFTWGESRHFPIGQARRNQHRKS
jgi:hypothetical protein